EPSGKTVRRPPDGNVTRTATASWDVAAGSPECEPPLQPVTRKTSRSAWATRRRPGKTKDRILSIRRTCLRPYYPDGSDVKIVSVVPIYTKLRAVRWISHVYADAIPLPAVPARKHPRPNRHRLQNGLPVVDVEGGDEATTARSGRSEREIDVVTTGAQVPIG